MGNQANLKKATNILRAIAHPVRLSIIKFIAEKGSTNVNKIYNTLKLEQSITSQHLRVLRSAELVETTRDGKFIHYSINAAKITKLNKAVAAFMAKKVEIDFDPTISLNGDGLDGKDGHNGTLDGHDGKLDGHDGKLDGAASKKTTPKKTSKPKTR